MPLPPNNAEDALYLIDEMEGYYQDAFTSFEEDDNFYEGTLEDVLELPEGFDVTIPTTARAIVDEAVDNVDPYDISVFYAPRSFSKKGQEDADAVARFLTNTWKYWRVRSMDIDPIRDFIKNLFKNGKGVLKIVPDWSLWPQLSASVEAKLLEEKDGREKVKERASIISQLRKENFPVTIKSMSPRHVMEDPSMDARKLWVIERYDTNEREVENRYAEHLPFIQRSFGEVGYQIHEVWTATWVDWDGDLHLGKHFIFVNRTLVEEEDNLYHEVPYVIKYSGFGRETYDGSPEAKATGFYTLQVKSMLRAEIRRASHFDAMMAQFAFPIAFFPEEVEDIPLDMTPAGVNFVPESVLENFDKIFLQAKLPTADYLQSLNMIQSMIERGTTQRAVRGAGVPGTDSAAQLSMITSQAKLRLEPVKRATEEACDQVNALTLKYIEKVFEEPVSVFAAEPDGADMYTLKPASIKGKYRTKTTFMPSEEQVKERKLMLAAEAKNKMGLNDYDALVYANWPNPMETIERNLAYEIMKEPAIKRALAKQAAELWGLDATEMELEELQEQASVQQILRDFANQLMAGSTPGTGDPTAPPGGDAMAQQGGMPMGMPGVGVESGGVMPQQQGGGVSPQVQGAPNAQVNPLPSVNDVNQSMGGMQ